MLNPDTTVLLTDALLPPPGFDVDVAVVTTYSLDLTAVLVAPMAFALGNVDDARAIGSGDPVQMLDAVKRHIGHTTVFCQAAAIHVPATHSRILAFLEDSIFQVEPPGEDALFHPKLWVLRFVRPNDGALHHRVVVASRNLTFDSSWDTALVLDEGPYGTIKAAPAADFVAQLPTLCTDELPESRATAIQDLCTTLRTVRLESPEPFTGGELLPLGLAADSSWPFTEHSDRMLAISPFLTAGTLKRLRATTSEATLLSRAASLDQLGARATAGWDLQVLSSGVDLFQESEKETDEVGASLSDAAAQVSGGELTGLHAKTVVVDHPRGRSTVVTGSANITAAAWGRNVEFNAVLTGLTATCGVEAVLGRESKEPGLQMIMEPYTPAAEDPSEDPAIATSYLLEGFHRELARSDPRPRLDIIPRDDASASARLTLTLPAEVPGETEIWLSTVPGQRRPLGKTTIWDIAIENITPFIAIETTAGSGAARLTRRCLIMVPIIGDPLERRQRALAGILNSSERVLRYLAFLLGIDDDRRAMASDRTEGTIAIPVGEARTKASYTVPPPPVVLFEPLVRAVGVNIGRLAAVADQIAEIRALPEAETLIPAEFLQMWDVVLNVVRTRRTA
ncbi:phospholipase D family protein [Pseudarthrobacter sp. R1]|uniref:phospholipase D family protein n=1 Tax=Pseudarthrobacter sp. R1 TaxID=2944934 RepID=UPI0021093AB4|nr:phospholipase D family protein [Pseudarthrobacter sp. R1]MCQ6269116.1 phospholipase D family protein [Pseudarthrobacter sp. R1]